MRRLALALLLSLGLSALPALGADALKVPVFADETLSAGIDSIYAGEWQYMVGGGVATFDCNADGFPDMLLAGGEAPAKFYRNVSPQGGALKFELQASGLELDAVTGAYPLDIDSDGLTDIVELRVGEAVAMRGLGGCKFERANEAWGFDGGDEWWTAFAATWEHGNDWPTLALGSYIDRTQEIDPWGSCTDNWLERPDWTRTGFAKPLPLKPSYCALSMLFTDWNLSGTPALRIANDREYYLGGQEQLWKLDPRAEPVRYADKDGWKALKIWGMGIASGDVTGDGYPDYFVTSMADNKLQTLAALPADGQPAPTFKDVAFPMGAIAQRPYIGGDARPSTAWHAQFEDVNNDGMLDLFVAKGNVSEMPDFALKDPNNLLLGTGEGKFVEVGDKAGIASMAVSRGAMLTDFNLDGLLDLVVVNRWVNAQLWRNVTADPASWIEVKPHQDGINRDAVGGWIEVKSGNTLTRREITVGGGHVSGQTGWWHFGLDGAAEAQLRIIWPDGTAGDWQQVKANGFYVATPGEPAQPWSPG